MGISTGMVRYHYYTDFSEIFYTIAHECWLLVDYEYLEGEYSVPPEINNVPVSGIMLGALQGCQSLYRLNLPESIEYIGMGALQSCVELSCLTYAGTVEQWNAAWQDNNWSIKTNLTEVQCLDGSVEVTGWI